MVEVEETERERVCLAYKLLLNWRRAAEKDYVLVVKMKDPVITPAEKSLLNGGNTQMAEFFCSGEKGVLVYLQGPELLAEDCRAMTSEIGTLLNVAARVCPEAIERIVPPKDRSNIEILKAVAPELVLRVLSIEPS